MGFVKSGSRKVGRGVRKGVRGVWGSAMHPFSERRARNAGGIPLVKRTFVNLPVRVVKMPVRAAAGTLKLVQVSGRGISRAVSATGRGIVYIGPKAYTTVFQPVGAKTYGALEWGVKKGANLGVDAGQQVVSTLWKVGTGSPAGAIGVGAVSLFFLPGLVSSGIGAAVPGAAGAFLGAKVAGATSAIATTAIKGGGIFAAGYGLTKLGAVGAKKIRALSFERRALAFERNFSGTLSRIDGKLIGTTTVGNREYFVTYDVSTGKADVELIT
ncbi:MAG: hypothetical protein NUV57_02030 [archaeon]|nr:hypothetical protein [archaeon]